jgi:hypothetical protein
MGKPGVAVIALLVGLLLGAVGGLSLGGGAFAGAGAATGMATGICATVQAAQQIGVMNPRQVDQVLARAASNFAGAKGIPKTDGQPRSAKACDDFMAKLLE